MKKRGLGLTLQTPKRQTLERRGKVSGGNWAWLALASQVHEK